MNAKSAKRNSPHDTRATTPKNPVTNTSPTAFSIRLPGPGPMPGEPPPQPYRYHTDNGPGTHRVPGPSTARRVLLGRLGRRLLGGGLLDDGLLRRGGGRGVRRRGGGGRGGRRTR